jgi:hypothetical protein
MNTKYCYAYWIQLHCPCCFKQETTTRDKKKRGEGRNQNYQTLDGEHYYLVFFVCFFLIKLKRFPMAKI